MWLDSAKEGSKSGQRVVKEWSKSGQKVVQEGSKRGQRVVKEGSKRGPRVVKPPHPHDVVALLAREDVPQQQRARHPLYLLPFDHWSKPVVWWSNGQVECKWWSIGGQTVVKIWSNGGQILAK